MLEAVVEAVGLEPMIRAAADLLRSLTNSVRMQHHLALEVVTKMAVVIAHLVVGVVMRKVIVPRLCRLCEESLSH